MGALLAPGLENERSSRRRGAPAKNHARENVLAIRDAQRANRERREEEEQKKAKVFKMKKFENVASRLMDAPRPRVGALVVIVERRDGRFLGAGPHFAWAW